MERKIKVCQVASSDFTLQFMLKNQLLFLQSEGYDVTAVCSPGKWVSGVEKEGIKVKTVKFKRSISPLFDIVTFINLYRYFKKEKFDIVHTHTFKPDLYGQIAAYLAGVPIIIRTSHGFAFGETSSFLKKKMYLLLERYFTGYSDVFLSIGRHILAESIKENIGEPEKMKYLGRDIDTQKYNPARFSDEQIIAKKKQLGISPDKKIVGIVARLVEEKGYLELFEAFKLVLEKFPNTLLVSIGPHEPEKLDALDINVVKTFGIEKNVIFLGERQDVDELYPLMDVFVLPTHMEGLGASILEASAFEKPVIATNTGGCPETINDGKTGMLFPLKNVQKLAEAIMFMLENPQKARHMGVEGRKKVIREFSNAIVLSRLGEAYRQIISEKLGSFEEQWLAKYDAMAKKPGARDYEISFWSEQGLEYYKNYFTAYFTFAGADKLPAKILDIGSGLGTFSRMMVKNGHQVFGLDYSKDIVDMARARFENAGIEFSTGNIHQLPYPDSSFDAIFCSGVFQCIGDYKKALAECRRVLKPGGTLAIMTLNKLSLTIFLQKELLHLYNPYVFKKELQNMGFEKIAIRGMYILPAFLSGLSRRIMKGKWLNILNAFFPITMVVSHSFYIEAIKK